MHTYGARAPRTWWTVAAACGMVAVAVAPMVALLVTRAGRHYLPVQDFAVIDLRVRDVFSRDTPLVGPYSRYGWDHPGPMVFWLVAPFARLFGAPAWATQVGFGLLQAGAAVWLGIVTWRRRGLWAVAFWLAVLSSSLAAVGPAILLQPWGPHVTVAFFVLFCALVWLVRGDDRSLVVQSVVVGSFLVQTHLGYAPLVAAGALLIVAELRLAAGGWSRLCRQRSVRHGLLVAFVLWLPPLVEVVLHPPGNLAQLVYRTLIHPSAAPVGVSRGLGLLAGAFRPVPAWLGGRQPLDFWHVTATSAGLGWLLGVVALLAGAGWASQRAGDEDGRRLAILCGSMMAAGAVALAGIEGPAYPYLFYWLNPLAALTMLSAVRCCVRALRNPGLEWSVAHEATWPCFALTILVTAIPLALHVTAAPSPYDRFGVPTAELLRQLDSRHEPASPVLIRVAGTALGGVEGGLIDQLSRQGAPFRVDDGRPYQFGRDRGAGAHRISAIWYVIEESDQVSLLSKLAGAKIVAQVQPLERVEAVRLTTLQRELADQLAHADRSADISILASPLVGFALRGVAGIRQRDLDQLGALNAIVDRHVCECTVISVPMSDSRKTP